LTSAPLKRSWARSSPIKWRESATTLSRIGDLPPRDEPTPTSCTRPSSIKPATICETVVRVSPVMRAISARLTVALPKTVPSTRSRLWRLVCCCVAFFMS
jgi:hypothetical protein